MCHSIDEMEYPPLKITQCLVTVSFSLTNSNNARETVYMNTRGWHDVRVRHIEYLQWPQYDIHMLYLKKMIKNDYVCI